MAGDCPHSDHLEASLKHCHDKSIVMAATHETYRKIIDDLKNDLEQISCEVIMVQKECSDQDKSNETDDINLETSLRELETQNDRLEQALKLQTQTKDAAFTQLQTNNENLKCQNDHLQSLILERDQRIMQLNSKLKSISQTPCSEPLRAAVYGHSHNNCCGELEKKIELLKSRLEKSSKQEHFLHRETRKLNEELNDSKRKNGDLTVQSQRLAKLLKSQESHRMELVAKYELLGQNFEDQAKKLRAANSQLSMLSDRFQLMEKRQAEHDMERDLLRAQVLSLKEKEACVMGKNKSMQEQLTKIEKELYTAHDVIKQQKCVQQSTEFSHNELAKRFQKENFDLKRKLSQLIEDYKTLQQQYDNQGDIIKQQETIIKSFQKWKETQMRAEGKIREGFREYENHIKLLLEEKHKLLNQFHDIYKDYHTLQIELDRLKMCSFSTSYYNSSHNISDRTIADRLEVVRRTASRISEQSSTLKDEEPSIGKPSEEPS